MDRYELGLATIGLVALLAAWVPAYTSRRPLSLPVVLVATGVVLAALPFDLLNPDPRSHVQLVERFTEFGVIVAIMGAGLKLDRPFSWRGWSHTWRMLAIAMPITIAATAWLGSVIGGLSGASAVLLGSVLAPTDPVLASDVQVGEPTVGEEDPPSDEDDVRFTLTSEGGLNDALAFPFVYLAIRLADGGLGVSGVLAWISWDLIGRVVIGVVVGYLVGRLLGIVAFRPPGPLVALAETPQGFVAVAATLLAYGATELAHGYGFLAVFVAAVVLRGSERNHEFHSDLHGFSEQTENLLAVGLLLMFGGALVSGVLDGLTVGGAAIALLIVFVVRPVSGQVALIGSSLTSSERWVVSFFGIRGFGSIYYLAYALTATRFTDGDELWSIVAITLLISIVVHGIAATPAMNLVDDSVRRRSFRHRVLHG